MEETAENKSSVTPYRYALRGLRGEMEKPAPFPIGMSVSKATAVSALTLSSTTRPEGKKENKINAHERSEAKTQSNTSSESLVVEDGREQSRERDQRERRKG